MKLFKNFLKDQMIDFAGYAGITALILFYYRLIYGEQSDLLYPLLLSVFVMMTVTVIKGFRYFRFHKAIETADYEELLQKGASREEQAAIDALKKLHVHYQSQIGDLINRQDEAYALIAQLVHDLKIPISVIRLVLEGSGEDNPDGDSRNKIMKESDKLLNKLSQLLGYLRLGRFDRDYQIERVNLIEEIRNAINFKKDYFIMNNIYPHFDAGQAPLYILTDKKWHGMLLDQLISNAVKYSAAKAEKGFIDFSVTRTGEYLELRITDYGIGIPEYDLQRIFEPFFTGENGRRVSNSTGIGLYLCHSIADKLGHRLTVTSVYGEKTQVTLRYAVS